MKKITFIAEAGRIDSSGDQINIDGLSFKEVTNMHTTILLIARATIDIDYGDKNIEMVKDGNRIHKFNSEIDALNYLGEQGWELVLHYPAGNKIRYIMKKKH